jgi:hypothetical protein
VLACGLAWFMPATARAFHAGSTFDKTAGAGGGDGLFYTGSPFVEHGWTCTACHLSAPGAIRLDLVAMPSVLLDRRSYTPDASYQITATLVGEHLGIGSPRANYNSLALTIVQSNGAAAGFLSGYAPDDFYNGGDTTIASAGQKVGITAWSFTWTAPPAGTGPVTLYACVVDGNGANSPPTGTLTDPLGDDVYCSRLALTEAPAGLRAGSPNQRPRAKPRP